jgi:hypothetical protein
MVKIKRALISLSDKNGILDLARALKKFDVEIISTGGTAKLLRENNIQVQDVSLYTGFPEMLIFILLKKLSVNPEQVLMRSLRILISAGRLCCAQQRKIISLWR